MNIECSPSGCTWREKAMAIGDQATNRLATTAAGVPKRRRSGKKARASTSDMTKTV